jgi:hypothetical protein
MVSGQEIAMRGVMEKENVWHGSIEKFKQQGAQVVTGMVVDGPALFDESKPITWGSLKKKSSKSGSVLSLYLLDMWGLLMGRIESSEYRPTHHVISLASSPSLYS